MLFDLMFFKMEVSELEQRAKNELDMKEFIYWSGQRVCGYYEECELKYRKRYPKTYKRYEQAKEDWYKMYDKCYPMVEVIKEKERKMKECDIQIRIEILQKEIKELTNLVDKRK